MLPSTDSGWLDFFNSHNIGAGVLLAIGAVVTLFSLVMTLKYSKLVNRAEALQIADANKVAQEAKARTAELETRALAAEARSKRFEAVIAQSNAAARDADARAATAEAQIAASDAAARNADARAAIAEAQVASAKAEASEADAKAAEGVKMPGQSTATRRPPIRNLSRTSVAVERARNRQKAADEAEKLANWAKATWEAHQAKQVK